MTDRVRALLVTPDGDLLTIRRRRPGQELYWVLPGGHVEHGESFEGAMVGRPGEPQWPGVQRPRQRR